MIPKISDRIIIVDDMPVMADVISERLQVAGFENIVVYTDPREALQAIRDNTRPAIVVSDFNMPGMTGVELLTELERRHPEINGIIVTGNPADALRRPHRYAVLDKSHDVHAALASHILRTIKSHLVPLLPACPSNKESSTCPLYQARRLCQPDLAAWLADLKPQAIHSIFLAHETCALTP
jgi:CheY-like chemotaxis protein